ncbi:tetratricopeptide repeat protein [Curtobacterium sp. NPDC089689]|uniref:tetratricopeptide repeat protein n=1 Tax=Curtobacterium sp. NPDC089689 TaxID=3363968 RepID=UPI00381B7F95
MNDDKDKEQRILLDALISYSDSCTLPNLTPSCPFFSIQDGRPSCGEECRDIAQARGAAPRRVRAKNVGGLVLLGRELPGRVLAGEQSFDAAEIRLQHKGLELFAQPTTSLLLGLRDLITGGAFQGSSNTGEGLAYWGELERRQFPIERIATGGLVDGFAVTVALSVVTPILVERGVTPFGSGVHLRDGLKSKLQADWTGVLGAASDSWHKRLGADKPQRRVSTTAFARSILGPLLSESVTDDMLDALLESDPLLSYALRPDSLHRIGSWLAHLFETNLEAALGSEAPEHVSTFGAFPLRPRDEVAKWLSDRFTQTNVDHWMSSSLTLEWRHLSGYEDSDCPALILAERPMDRALIAERALDAISSRRPKHVPAQPIRPDLFVDPAKHALMNEEWRDAIGIFEGLTKMLPTDHGAWNNLGFCQMAEDDAEALGTLRHAATMRQGNSLVNIGNRILAHHRLGQDDQALKLAALERPAGVDSHATAVMWAHPAEPRNKLLDNVKAEQYIDQLIEHIRSGAPCSVSRM